MGTALRPKAGPPRSYRFPEFTDEKLPTGIRLVTAEVSKLPVVTLLVLVDAGSTNDPVGKEGVAALTAGLLLEGTAELSGTEISEKFERVGTSVDSGADWDSAVVKLTALSDRLEDAARQLAFGEVAVVFLQDVVEALGIVHLVPGHMCDAVFSYVAVQARHVAEEVWTIFHHIAHIAKGRMGPGARRRQGAWPAGYLWTYGARSVHGRTPLLRCT